MILVVGGAGAGKREYVKSLGYADADIADAVLDMRPAVINVQNMIFGAPGNAADLLEPLCAKEIVVCDEVGSGVIPLERAARDAREEVGRLCVMLARRAERVVRVVAGIPVVIKG